MQQSSRGDMVIYYTDNVFADRMETRLKLHNRIENMHGHSKMGVSSTMKNLCTRTYGNAHLPSIID